MLARVARYQVEPDRCNDAVAAFQESASELSDLDGLEHGYILVDSDEGVVTTVTLWRDQQTMDASETRAAGLRQRAAHAVDGEVVSVHVFDTVREFGE